MEKDDGLVSIDFLETKVVQDERAGTANEERYEEGKTYRLSPRSADRWVKRGVAKFSTDEDAGKGAGASSDVSLNLQDRDRVDPTKFNAQPPQGTDTPGYTPKKDPEADKPAADAPAIDDEKVKAAVDARDFDSLTKAQLETLASGANIDVSSAKTKADLVAILGEKYPKAEAKA